MVGVLNIVLILVSHRKLDADHGFALVTAGPNIFRTETPKTS